MKPNLVSTSCDWKASNQCSIGRLVIVNGENIGISRLGYDNNYINNIYVYDYIDSIVNRRKIE